MSSGMPLLFSVKFVCVSSLAEVLQKLCFFQSISQRIRIRENKNISQLRNILVICSYSFILRKWSETKTQRGKISYTRLLNKIRCKTWVKTLYLTSHDILLPLNHVAFSLGIVHMVLLSIPSLPRCFLSLSPNTWAESLYSKPVGH